MLKIGSVSECSFKEVVEESKSWWQRKKELCLQLLTNPPTSLQLW